MPLLSCSNAQRDYLRPFGYGTLALPKVSVQPLTMLSPNGGRLTPIGPLIGTFKPGAAPLPDISRGKTAGISGARSKSLDAGLALDILGTAISALSGSTLGFKAAYKDASEVEFEFGDVFENSVDVTALDSYLANAEVSSLIGPALKKLLDKDKVYVIVATIDARQISVKAKASSGTDLGLEVPVVQQLVGGKITIGAKAGSSSVLTYSSTELPLAVGAKVVRLAFDGLNYRTLDLVKPGDATLGIEAGAASQAQQAPDELIEL